MFYLLNIASVLASSEIIGNAVGAELAFIKWATEFNDDSAFWPSVFFGLVSATGLTNAKASGVSIWFNNIGIFDVPLVTLIGSGWFYAFWNETYNIIVKVGGSPYVQRWVTNMFNAINAGLFTAATVWLLSLIGKL